MARKFLLGIAILVGLFLVGAVLFRVFQDELMAAFLVPKGEFDITTAPPTPDYTDWSSWAAGEPGIETPAGLRPDGIEYASRDDVAIFYLHPTTYWSNKAWNGPLDDTGHLDLLNVRFLPSQASIFDPFGVLYAPYYRQVALGAFIAEDENMRGALALAYEDVLAAFDQFLALREERPILLVGHSQGAYHLLSVLHDRIAALELENELVAAYLIGWPLSVSGDLPQGLAPCAAPEQTNCVISWQTFGPDGDTAAVMQAYNSEPALNGSDKPGDILCVNPISFRQSLEPASAAENIGGVPMPSKAGEPLGAPMPGATGARCAEDGFLYMDRTPDRQFQQLILPGDNYHSQDLPLFYRNIQANLERRITAYFDAAGAR